jgi:5-formyltetrahydrofolate cyclo-ligase
LAVFVRAKTLGCYVSVKGEVDTRTVIQTALSRGKLTCVPLTSRNRALQHVQIESLDDLSPSGFGLLEPLNLSGSEVLSSALDLIIVPGIAFDPRGNRIGFGAGFYDRYLEKTPATKIGLAYDFQILEKVPLEPHDIALDIIVTPTRVFFNA